MTATVSATREFAAALREAIDGEVDGSKRRRAEYSTDASNYRVVPQVVAMPRDADDLIAALAVAREHQVPVTMRGGGTSVAGNAIGPGLVIDTSRHMNKVLSIDADAKTARVQPGAVLAQLQWNASQHGLRFGPDPSTGTRATLGGMIGNNACGPHAVAYGKTSDNVVSLDAVDGTGRRFLAADDLAVIPGLEAFVAANLALFRTDFGRFSRQVSGYSFEHLLPENGNSLARFLVGSEGTLATVVEAEVALKDIAQVRLMAVLGYEDMPSAADAVVPIMAHGPHALEGLDARLVERIRRAPGDQHVPELPAGAGWLFVEVGAETRDQAEATLEAIIRDSQSVGRRQVDDPREAKALWSIRAAGAGLAGRSADNAESWPGWEDAAVPPEHLGDYLRDFDALMDKHGVVGQPFGHFGDGCVHVRVDIPLRDDGSALREFAEEGADLVMKYGGSLSGEHGDGRARSELLKIMYSEESIAAFGQVKHLFDPKNVMNPGVMVDPAPLDADLRRPAAPAVPRAGGFAFGHDHGDLSEAVHRCTGVGSCRGEAIQYGNGFMCPSYAATDDEKDVTRGRARVLQEAINGALIKGLTSREVAESLDLCLSCKACSSECPSGVDMAAYKSEVLHRKYRRRLRPITHYTIGRLPGWLHLIGLAPRLVNALLKPRWIAKTAVWVAGMDTRRTLPVFATTPFRKSAAARARVADGPPEAATGARSVVLWADSFTDNLDPDIPDAIIAVLEDAGIEVIVAGGAACCGVSYISTGQLDLARKRLDGLLGVLGPFAINSIPIVGIEPSCTAALRSDLVELLPNDPRAHAVASGVFTLAEVLTGRAPVGPREGWAVPSLADVTTVVQPHCHQYSVMGYTADREVLAAAGAAVTEAAGCCGLAGNWGTERGHYETSVKVAENSLLPKLRKAPVDAIYLADGISCRTQVEDLADVKGQHLAQLLRGRLTGK